MATTTILLAHGLYIVMTRIMSCDTRLHITALPAGWVHFMYKNGLHFT